MKELLVSCLMIWILSVTFLSDNLFAEITDSLPSHNSQERKSMTSSGPMNHQNTGKSDDDHTRKKKPVLAPPRTTSFCHFLSDHLQPMDGATNCTLQGGLADCSGLNLTSVPQKLPANIRILDLSLNCLMSLSRFPFAPYPGLESLNLSLNRIRLEPTTFYKLSLLEVLDLSFNKLSYKRTFSPYPHRVFCPLTSLTYLDISSNNLFNNFSGLKYPDIALSCLRNLETLAIDGLPMNNQSSTFGHGFKNLTKLTTLKISGSYLSHPYCHLGGLYSHSFENLETLESLTLKNCNITGDLISGKPFHNLKKLRKLDLSLNSNIGIENLQPIFDGLYHLEYLTEFNVGSIVNRYSLCQCLDVSIFKNFPPHLTTLIATDNNLEAVTKKVMSLLPVNLSTLDLSGNRFTIGSYLRRLFRLEHLSTLYLNGYSTRHEIPLTYPYREGPLKPTSHNCTTFMNYSFPFILSLPPRLVTLEMNNVGLNFDWTHFVVDYHNSLSRLSASGNHFQRLEGPINGVRSLKYLDLSMCGVREIGHEFFDTFFSLEVLRLDSNALGDFLSDVNNQVIFYSLDKLKSLNLTNNGITFLPPQIFRTLTDLTSLYLGKNFLTTFNVNLTDIVALSMLDLAHTHVATLSEQTRAYFDNLIKKGGVNVSIKMENTPISCKCSNLQFLQWMTTSQAFPKPLHHYYCDIVYLGHPPITDDYEETMTILRRQCASNALLLFLVISSTLTLSALIVGAIVYRFRWNIRYLYYAIYLRFKKNSNAPENERDYDAFICYASEDAEFAEHTLDRELSGRGLRIFLHGRDFKAGDYVSSNIVNAVCSSKKTVVLLTKALLDSYWCGYEIEMAKLEGINTGRPVLIFVFLEDIPKNKLSRDLLYNIKNNTYVEYMNSALDPDQLRLWWDKLANDVKD